MNEREESDDSFGSEESNEEYDVEENEEDLGVAIDEGLSMGAGALEYYDPISTLQREGEGKWNFALGFIFIIPESFLLLVICK